MGLSESHMRVLQLAPKVCWPLDTGAKLRNYHLARVLSENASVALLAFTDADQPTENPGNTYERVVIVKRDPGYTLGKILRGALGSAPISLLNYTTEAMKRALAKMLGEQNFDVVQIESIHLMGYLPIIRAATGRAVVVCDWHNIESELMMRYSERGPGYLHRTYARKTVQKLRALEQQAIGDFDVNLVVSDRDRDQLLQINSSARVSVIANGVDSAYYSDKEIEKAHTAWKVQPAARIGTRGQSQAEARRVVFVGSMDYHANIHAVVDFARQVWPAIHDRDPDLVFTIVGRDPAAEVTRLASTPGIDVTGTVDDVRPYYREAVASIVPLRVGGGSRLKILESMAAGVPVVSTTLGAEGLEVRDGVDIVIADTNEQLIEAITGVVENGELRRRLAVAGRDLVARRYEWSIVGKSLFKIYQDLLADRTS